MKMTLGDQEIKGIGSYEFSTYNGNDTIYLSDGTYLLIDIKGGAFTVKDGRLWLNNGHSMDMPKVWDGFKFLPTGGQL